MRLLTIWLFAVSALAALLASPVMADSSKYVGLTDDQVKLLDNALAAAQKAKLSPEHRAALSKETRSRWAARSETRSDIARKLKTRSDASLKAAADKSRQRLQRREKRLAKWEAAASAAVMGGSGESFNLNAELAKLPVDIQSKARANGAEMRRLAAAAPSGQISMDAAQVDELILAGPRPYHVIVTGTALTNAHRCDVCRLLDAAQAVVSDRLRSQNAALIGDGVPVYFVTLELAHQAEAIKAFSLQPPSSVAFGFTLDGRRSTPRDLVLAARHRFSPSQAPSPNDVVTFVARATGVTIALPTAAVPMSAALGGLAIITAVVVALYFFYDKLSFFRRLTPLYAVGACVGYIYGVSGGMFNVISKTAFSGIGRDGLPTYIAPGHQQQFGAESVILGASYLACALVCVLLTAYAFDRSTSAKHLEVKQNVAFEAAVADARSSAAAASSSSDSSGSGSGSKSAKASRARAADVPVSAEAAAVASGDVPPSITLDDALVTVVAKVLPKTAGLKDILPLALAALYVFGWTWIVQVYTRKNAGYRYGRVW